MDFLETSYSRYFVVPEGCPYKFQFTKKSRDFHHDLLASLSSLWPATSTAVRRIHALTRLMMLAFPSDYFNAHDDPTHHRDY